jgi:DNA-binding beta-propeller fold protein YncE
MTAEVTILPARISEEIGEDPGKRRRRRKALVLLLLFLGLALLLGIAIWYLLFRQPINPLPPIPATQIPAYSTSIYGAVRPVGVAVSPDGDRIYVMQGAPVATGIVFNAAGEAIGEMAPPASTGANHQPVYAAVDPVTQEVYVTDRPTGAIYVYDRDGAFQREFSPATPIPGWQPLGIAFDQAGNLYVTDLSGPFEKVLVIDRAGAITRTLGEAENLSFPNGITVDKDGTIFVTDSNNGRLLMFGSDGKGVVVSGRGAGAGSLGLPRGVGVDSSARLFTVDTSFQGVLVYGVPKAIATAATTRDVVGWIGGRGGRSMSVFVTRVPVPADAPTAQSGRLEYLGSFGVPGVADGQFSFPNSVAIDSRGRVYVTDTFNDRIQIWSY